MQTNKFKALMFSAIMNREMHMQCGFHMSMLTEVAMAF